MFARLILALLLAAFALPALANGPCHDAAMQPTMVAAMAMPAAHNAVTSHGHPHHGMPASDNRAIVPHMCIGCIPPATIAPRAITVPLGHAAIPRLITASAFAPGLRAPPILRPPRATA